MAWRKFFTAAFAVCVAIQAAQPTPPSFRTLVVYSPHPADFIDAIVKEFEVETGIKAEVVSAGTGELLTRIEAERDNPSCDVLWGGSRASLEKYKQYFEPYVSENEDSFIARYIEDGRLYTPFTAIPTVFMYNSNLVPAGTQPRSWADLLDSKWRGKIAFADPALSSSSFEALVNMLFALGGERPEKGWDYVARFVENLDGRLLGGSSVVYNGVANGEYAIGVTFEEAAAIYRRQGAAVGIVYPSEGTIVEPDGVAVIRGAENRENARLFVDFVTSKKVQTKIAKDLNRRSCRVDVPPVSGLPDTKSIRVIQGDYKWAGINKEKILEEFEDIARR